MTKYRNPRVEAEMNEDKEQEEVNKVLAEPASSVEEEMWKTRYSDLRRHQQSKETQFQQEIEDLRRQVQAAASGKLQMPKSKEEVDAWSREYPDFRAILDTLVQDQVKAITRTSEEKLSKLEERQADLAKKEAFIKLEQRHPDLKTLLKKNSDFHKWLMAQSARDQNAIIRSLDVDDADFVIQKYKLKNKSAKVADDDNEYKDAARHVRVTSEASEDYGSEYDFTETQIASLSSREYEKLEEKIMTAMRKGRVLYDISGAAR